MSRASSRADILDRVERVSVPPVRIPDRPRISPAGADRKGLGEIEIVDGGTARREYLRVKFGEVPAEEKARIRNQRKKWYSLDTSGMVAIVEALKVLVRWPDFSPAMPLLAADPHLS